MPRTYLKVPFPQKDAAKSLGAKWDATIGSWYVPETVDLTPFGPWMSGSLSPALVTPTPAPASSTALAEPSRATTALAVGKTGVPLSRLLAGVASAIASAYKAGVWTTVEVTDVKPRGGHVYLELSERDKTGTLIAKATGTIWAATANRILPEFERATGATLAPGIKLLVRARPVYKPQFGFSVDIEAIDPDYTLGDLEARKREIRARLQAEGIFGAQKLLATPWDFNAILVVAPDGAAGLGDFQAESHRLEAHGICRFVHVHSRFQGEGAADEIASALAASLARWREAHGSTPDAIAIIRGGGAVNDLAWLNNYELARLVCTLPVPVFTGIGHERDSTVIDEVAHTKFDTPSKVIGGIEQVIVRRIREASNAYETVVQATELATQRARSSVDRLDAEVRADTARQIDLSRRKALELQACVKEIAVTSVHRARTLANEGLAAVRQGAAQTLARAGSESKARADFVLERAGSHVLRVRVEVDGSFGQVAHGSRQVVREAQSSSEALLREITGQGPDKTLGRGFAVIRDEEGRPVTRMTQVDAGQAVSVQFMDGSVVAHVDGRQT